MQIEEKKKTLVWNDCIPLHTGMIGYPICDAIKQNESELGKNKNKFSFSLYAIIPELCWNSHQHWTHRDIAMSVMFETVKYRGIWMVLMVLSKIKHQ